MRFFILLSCLVAAVFSSPYWEHAFEENLFGHKVPKFTCDRHVVMRCFNIYGEEVDQFGYPLKNYPAESEYPEVNNFKSGMFYGMMPSPHPWL